MYILGISAFYHDSAAALICDGDVIAAAQEERFSRIKHDFEFPFSAIKYVLEEANIKLEDIDKVIFYETEDDLLLLLKKIKPDVRIIGSDWRGKQFTGHNLPIKIYFNSRDHTWSTSNLRNRIYNAEIKKRNLS